MGAVNLAEQAAKVSAATHVACAIIATQAARAVLELWRATRSRPKVWRRRGVSLIRTYRAQTREVTLAGEALRRALVTKSSWVDGADVKSLKQSFESTVRTYAPAALTEAKGFSVSLRDVPDVKVENDPLEALERALKAEEERADREVANTLHRLSEAWERRKEESLADDTFDGQVAGSGSKLTMDGARGAQNVLGKVDRKVLGWVRVHNPRNGKPPCPFCAILLSQGPVYKSAKAAGGTPGAIKEYHRHCQCYAECVYVGQSYDTDSRYAENRKWRELYDKKFAKLPTGERYRAWRNHLDLLAGKVKHERTLRRKNGTGSRPRARRGG